MPFSYFYLPFPFLPSPSSTLSNIPPSPYPTICYCLLISHSSSNFTVSYRPSVNFHHLSSLSPSFLFYNLLPILPSPSPTFSFSNLIFFQPSPPPALSFSKLLPLSSNLSFFLRILLFLPFLSPTPSFSLSNFLLHPLHTIFISFQLSYLLLYPLLYLYLKPSLLFFILSYLLILDRLYPYLICFLHELLNLCCRQGSSHNTRHLENTNSK